MNKVTDCANSLAMRVLAFVVRIDAFNRTFLSRIFLDRSLENIGCGMGVWAELIRFNWLIEIFDVISSPLVVYGKGIVAHLFYVFLHVFHVTNIHYKSMATFALDIALLIEI